MNVQQAPLYQLLYTSSLAPSAGIGELAGVARASRTRNADRGITGTLVFDGQRFCHYLEGPEEDVRALAQRIAVDPHHVDFTFRHQGQLDGGRRFAAWSLGYALAQDADALDDLEAALGDEAVDRLLQVLACCEREP